MKIQRRGKGNQKWKERLENRYAEQGKHDEKRIRLLGKQKKKKQQKKKTAKEWKHKIQKRRKGNSWYGKCSKFFSDKSKLFFIKLMIFGCKCLFKLDLNCIPTLHKSEQFMPMKRGTNPNEDFCEQKRQHLSLLLSEGAIPDLLQTLLWAL